MTIWKGERKTPERINQEYEAEIFRLRERQAQLIRRNQFLSTEQIRADVAEARVAELEREVADLRLVRRSP